MALFNQLNHTVDKIINNGNYDFSVIQLPCNVSNDIKEIKILNNGEDDYWEWMPNKGKFSLKSAWAHSRIEGELLTWCNKV